MQRQADFLGKTVVRPACVETTAMGAAFAAALATGFCSSLADIEAHTANHKSTTFTPSIDDAERLRLWHGWNRAVEVGLMLYWNVRQCHSYCSDQSDGSRPKRLSVVHFETDASFCSRYLAASF